MGEKAEHRCMRCVVVSVYGTALLLALCAAGLAGTIHPVPRRTVLRPPVLPLGLEWAQWISNHSAWQLAESPFCSPDCAEVNDSSLSPGLKVLAVVQMPSRTWNMRDAITLRERIVELKGLRASMARVMFLTMQEDVSHVSWRHHACLGDEVMCPSALAYTPHACVADIVSALTTWSDEITTYIDGVLYLHADMYVSPRRLAKLNMSAAWVQHFDPSAPVLSSPTGGWWWPRRGLIPGRSMSVLEEAQAALQALIRRFGDRLPSSMRQASDTQVASPQATGDIFYVPSGAYSLFVEFASIYRHVFHEAATPFFPRFLREVSSTSVVSLGCAGGCCTLVSLRDANNALCAHKLDLTADGPAYGHDLCASAARATS